MGRRIFGDVAGNTGVILAVAAVPLLVAAGAGVDMVRANFAQTVLQQAADAAAIAGGTSGENSPAALQQIVEDYVMANGGADYVSQINSVTPVLDTGTRTFSVQIDAEMNTSLMKLVNVDSMQIGAYSEVVLAGNGLEVALVLDNTASMNSGGRLAALKIAANTLVDELMEIKNTGGDVKVSVVPFSEYVNVGISNQNESWLTFPNGTSQTYNSCWNIYPNATSSNCHTEHGNYDNDGVPTDYTYEACDWDYGDPVQQCGTSTHTWQGCVGSRNAPLDEGVSALGMPYPGLLNAICPSELKPLTDDGDVLHNTINSLIATGNTYIPSGLIWGWNALEPNEPITGAKTKAQIAAIGGKKAIVLMTDGANTLSATYPEHAGSNAVTANAKTAAICLAAKADDIVIYTVGFMVTDASAINLLQSCASDPGKAFTADDPDALVQAFHDIGSQLAAVRLSK